MRLNLWLLDVFCGDQGGFRPSVWIRMPRRWFVLWLGWQRPGVIVLWR